MPTYSLTLRSEKNNRLSVEEMDNNLLYLQELALSGSAIDLENVTTDIIPVEDSIYSLGTSASQWKSLHVSGQTIYIGGLPLSTDGESLVVNSINSNSINLGTTASPLILSADNNNKLLLNGGGYRGFYVGINRLFGDDPNITQVFISKSANAIYKNKTNETDSEDFYVSNLTGSDTVVILNIYGLDIKKPLKLKHIKNFVEKFVDIVLYTNETLNSDLTVIRDSFYDNIEILTSSLPAGSLYNQFAFQDKNIEYSITPSNYNTTSMTGSGSFSLYKSSGDDYDTIFDFSVNKGYYFTGEGGPFNYNENFTYGFEENDILTISGTALGGQSPENDATIYVNYVRNGVITTLGNLVGGTGYTWDNDYYDIFGSEDGQYANAYITYATGSVTSVTLTYGGFNFVEGETITFPGGNDDATIEVLSVRDGVIHDCDIVGTPDYRSPYRNSQNPWPVMHIKDGGNDQLDNANYITTDKSITQFIGSIADDYNGYGYTLTVTKIISGTISVGQTFRHHKDDYKILTGTLTGGIGTYSVNSYYGNDLSEQIFTAYGINYGGGEIVENNTFGASSSYITLYDESIFAMVAINTDINEVYYTGDSGSDGNSGSKKEVNILIADNNTLSFGEEKLELSNKDLVLPETDTLGWMSVCGPLYNYDYNIEFTSTIIDDYGNTYAAGYEHYDDDALVVKFNKQGDKLWSRRIQSNNGNDTNVNSIKIDPINGDLIVLCRIYTGYSEVLIVRMDPMDGRFISSNRLKDLNGLDEQGDLYLYDMTFNSDNELIIVGQKTTDYLEWTIATSSVLLGSTFSTLVISPSSIGGDIPESTNNWSIAGTGIIGDENLQYINYFTGLTGSVVGSTQSSGAFFDIYKDQFNGNYNVYNTVSGSNYAVNDIITIPGNKLGGTSSNNCILTVTNVSESGNIYDWTVSGTGSTASLYFTTNTNVDFSASGTWSIYKSLQGEAIIYTDNWEKTLVGDEAYDRFNSVITDENNNIYCVGILGSDNNIYDKAIISKFSQNGVLQWTRVLNDREDDCNAQSVAIFGTNSLITTHYSDYDGQVVITKLTFDGNLEWQKVTSSDGSSAVVTDSTGIYIAVDNNDNNFYNSYNDYYPITIRLFKLNSDGVLIWNNTIGGREDFYLNRISIKNEKISIAGYTYVMADDYYNAVIANLPTDGTLALEQDQQSEYSGITSYVKGEYVIQSLTFSFYGPITPQVATHSITYTRDNNDNYNDYDFYIDNNIDKINEESGIIFGDGTKQTTSSGIMPQNYRPYYENYYLQLSDIGKHIYKDDGDGYRVYIPTNENVAFPIGTTITIVSGNGWTYIRADDTSATKLWGVGSNIYDTISSDFYIPDNSMATLLKIGIDKWMVSSPNLGNDD